MAADRKVALSLAARSDLRKAKSWYNSQQDGLGKRFNVAIAHSIDAIAAMPESSPIVYRGVRRTLVRVFPYGVFFRLTDTTLRILAVIHLHQDPSVWRSRADDVR